MLQDFDGTRPAEQHIESRLGLLRNILSDRQVGALIIPHADPYLSEQPPPHERRLEWITGFSGSAGTAIVSTTKAILFTDGRYTLQAHEQVPSRLFEIATMCRTTLSSWLLQNLTDHKTLCFAPALHSISEIDKFRDICANISIQLLACDPHPLDTVWVDRTSVPVHPVIPHPLDYAGRTSKDKIAQVHQELRAAHIDSFVTTQPENIAWLLNIRGMDIPHTPVPLCRLIIEQDKPPCLFIDSRKLDQKIRIHLQDVVTLHAPATLQSALLEICRRNITIGIDPGKASHWFRDLIENGQARVHYASDPINMIKSRKNAAEIQGARNAHLRDGLALSRFLCWLDAHVPLGGLSELDVAKELETCRSQTGCLHDLSFDSIVASGAHAALPHYRVDHLSNRLLENDSILLIDSGGQYQDGTTDVTRTVSIGHPIRQIRNHFTHVLKALIAVSTAKFPEGTYGGQIDAFARKPLWEAGLDFNHGTGHGVGSFLSVHEGPVSLSKNSLTPLLADVILSHEPAYYAPNQYGIRTENLVLTVPSPENEHTSEGRFLEFETLTLVPIDRRLIVLDLMNGKERAWVDDYHKTVWNALEAQLAPFERAWLEKNTSPLQ